MFFFYGFIGDWFLSNVWGFWTRALRVDRIADIEFWLLIFGDWRLGLGD